MVWCHVSGDDKEKLIERSRKAWGFGELLHALSEVSSLQIASQLCSLQLALLTFNTVPCGSRPLHMVRPSAKKVWAGHALSHDNNAEYYRPETEKVWQICAFVILGILFLCRHSRVGLVMKRCENDLKMVPDPCEESRQPGISTLCSAVSRVRVDCLDWSASPKLYILRRHMYLSLFTNINLRHQWEYGGIKKRFF